MLTALNEALGHDGDKVLAVLLGVAGMVTFLALVLGLTLINAWHSVRQIPIENALKQDMLDRGLTADEIALVISCSGTSKSARKLAKHNASVVREIQSRQRSPVGA